MELDWNLIERLMAVVSSRPDDQEEIAMMRQARNAVCYGGATNSLVSWTLSAAWEQIPAPGPALLACSGTIEIKPTQEDT